MNRYLATCLGILLLLLGLVGLVSRSYRVDLTDRRIAAASQRSGAPLGEAAEATPPAPPETGPAVIAAGQNLSIRLLETMDSARLALSIRPGVGLGVARLGMTIAEVEAQLGSPEFIFEHRAGSQWHYPSRGYAVLMDRAGVTGFMGFSPDTAGVPLRPFVGQCDRGLGIGSSAKQLRTAYGDPTSLTREFRAGTVIERWIYTVDGIEWTLINEQVAGVIVRRRHHSSSIDEKFPAKEVSIETT
ncbi:MAG: hypothetical protein QGG36_06325 [Pirellulaceae bacterium]|jgi:hypothetical protein|nr:hypothetical protein [Pirellulaceae bacterium]